MCWYVFENNTTKLLFKAFGFMLKLMNELDEVWARKLSEARLKAQTSGSVDVAEYLALKATNDLIRQTSVEWLFGSTLEIASDAIRRGTNITIENEHPHRFAFENATLAGSLVRFRQGVRCVSLEAGWTRTPNDGFMRGGALAAARIVHFGISKHNAQLLLLRTGDAPNWFTALDENRRVLFNAIELQRHFRVFLG